MDIMRRLKQDSAAANAGAQEGDSLGAVSEDDPFDTYEIYRVTCPDCRQPIALLADEDILPEHARCPSPWNPFGLTVCQGSGRAVSEAPETEDTLDTPQEQDAAVLLTLPAGLDWRRQPFSHVGGPGTRPVRVPRMRPRA
ncbi:hypothetical protein HXP44_09020 [Streptomyces sioyaensis]|uniref:Uncharacterized protein n=1 Tax=Streptomyces sioyaensis TaxID=67364 RepID=A0A4Q1QWK5_9ACTN|nr:hypothetical protein [Streptomyces sioyaensis]MBM4792191.1 hypothetical protein [Streptomyces sioyaensis]RXS67657.1 hypothetical protein EST54_11710 [Streptomyces sioyaensis]